MKRKDILFLLIPGSLLTLFWIGFTIYHNHTTPTISADLQEQIIPISPTFNTNVIEGLKLRIATGGLSELSITPAPGKSATIPSGLVASPSSSLTPANGGGVLEK